MNYDPSDKVWKFGYGSNMSPTFMKEKKNLELFVCKPAVLKGYKLIFSEALKYTEPAFADLIKSNEKDVEVHGVLSLMSSKSAKNLDKQEVGYNITKTEVICYDGEKILAEVYTCKSENPVFGPPSKRYMNILIKGAIEVGLKDFYIENLKKVEYYVPSKETLEKRKLLPPYEKLTPISLNELKLYNGKDKKEKWTSVMGYVFRCAKGWTFDSWIGRDVTLRNLYHFQGISLDLNDDTEKFPNLNEAKEDEIEYVRQNLDRCIGTYGLENLVGYLTDFAKCQK